MRIFIKTLPNKKPPVFEAVFVAHKGEDILCPLSRNKPRVDYNNLYVAYFQEITLYLLIVSKNWLF